MSSPFKIFRKHQKVLLVVAGLMAMIAFVILPIVLQNFGMRQGGSDPVVVTTTKYGDLKQSDMQNLRARHERVLRVLEMMISRLQPVDPERLRNYMEQQFGGSKEEELVNRWLMAHRAAELGINVSNDTISKFIKEQSMDKLTLKDVQEIVQQQGGPAYIDQMFYDDLRQELLVLEFRQISAIGEAGMPPGQRWDYYRRVHQQAQIECIPVPVAPFAATVEKPSDKVLEDYFQKYKDNLPSPYSSEPGFRVPQKIEVAYFMADVDKFAAPENITEEEIQTYYEKDAKKYDERNKQVLMMEAEKAAANKPPAEKEGDKKETPKDKPAEDANPAEGVQPAAPAVEKKDDEKKDTEQTTPPPEEKPEEKPADKPEEKPADKAEEKSSSVKRSPYRFASLLADDEKQDEPAQPKTDAPKAETPATSEETAASQPKPSAVEPKPADTKPAENKPAEAAGGEPPAAGEAAAKEPAGTTTEQAAPPQRQMTDVVRELTEEVRKEIRQRVAEDKIDGIFTKLEGLMRENAVAWKSYEAAKIHGEKGLKEPPNFDFAELAKQYGVTSGDTGEIMRWKAADLDIGKTILLGNYQRFYNAVFDNPPRQSEIGKQTPVKSRGVNDFYLFWKTKDIKETAAEWKDPVVQKAVLESWQLEQARKTALEKAKKLAEDARKSKSTLKEAFAGVAGLEVVTPPPFAWLIGGYDPRNPQYDLNMDVNGVEKPSEEFMQTVFDSDVMGVGTALNMPQTVAYVIQVEKFEPANDELWKRFLEDDFNRYLGAARSDMQSVRNAQLAELTKEAGLQWKRKADHFDKEKSTGD